MDLYEVESKIKELEASYNKEADNLMQELNAYKKKNPILPLYGDDPNVDKIGAISSHGWARWKTKLSRMPLIVLRVKKA